MATITAKVADYIGFTPTGDTIPSTEDIAQFATDAVVDIVNKSVLVFPNDIELFSAIEQNKYNATYVPSGIVLKVAREDGEGVAYQYTPAKQISRDQVSLAKNTESVNYASKYSPVWYFDHSGNYNRKVTVLPATENTDGERYMVSYVNYSTQLENGSTLAEGSDLDSYDVAYFPSNRKHLIPLYCAIRGLYLYIASEFKGASELFKRDLADDDSGSNEAESVTHWLFEEDVELTQATMAAMGGQSQFLMQYMQKLNNLKQEYMEAFSIKMAKDNSQPRGEQ